MNQGGQSRQGWRFQKQWSKVLKSKLGRETTQSGKQNPLSMDFSCCSAELFSQGVWAEVKDTEDPELQQLAGKLPQTVMHNRADSTVRKYLSAYKRWKRWALEHSLPVMPAKEQGSLSATCGRYSHF